MDEIKNADRLIVGKTFRRFYVSALITALGLSVAGIADSLVVGKMMGADGLSAIAFAMPIYLLYNIFGLGLGVGCGIRFAQKYAEGSREKASAVFANAFWSAVLIGVVLSAVGLFFLDGLLPLFGCTKSDGVVYALTKEYSFWLMIFSPLMLLKSVLYFALRADDAPKLATASMVCGTIADFVLNFVFVFGLKMGVMGAALATIIGAGIGCVFALPHLSSKAGSLKLKRIPFRPKDGFLSFKKGFASSSVYLFNFLVLMLMLNVIAKQYGTGGVAVYDVLFNISYILITLFDAVPATMQPMVATYLGERDMPLVRRTLKTALLRGGGLSVVLIALSAVFASPLCRLFGLMSPSLIAMGVSAVYAFVPAAVFTFINMVFCSYYQTLGNEKIAYIITTARSGVLLSVFVIVFALLGGNAFWWCWAAAEGVTTLGLIVYWLRSKSVTPRRSTDTDSVLRATLFEGGKSTAELARRAEAFCAERGAQPAQSYYVTLTLEELCEAILNNAEASGEQTYVNVVLVSEENGDFKLHLRDNAMRFNPFEMNDKKPGENAAIGVLLVKKKAKEFFYRRYQGFNTLLVKV